MSAHSPPPPKTDEHHGDAAKPEAGANDGEQGQIGKGAVLPDSGKTDEGHQRSGKSHGFLLRTFRRLNDFNGAVTALATCVIGLLTLAYVIVSSRQLSTMREQAAEADRAFAATERPWVTLGRPPGTSSGRLDMFTANPIVRNDQTGKFEWRIALFTTNVGRLPATNVVLGTAFVTFDASDPNAGSTFIAARDELCRDPRSNNGLGQNIFPGETRGPANSTLAVNIRDVVGIGRKLYLVICITYETMGAPDTRHKTEFMVNVSDRRGPFTQQTTDVPIDDIGVDEPTNWPFDVAY